MPTTTQTAAEIKRPVRVFLPNCDDIETLLALETMAADQDDWRNGHGLFQKIRSKNLVAERTGNHLKNVQYCFEEVCAKTLYNLSGSPAPFDRDAPDWIHPNALALAKALLIQDPDSVVGFVA